MSAIDALRITEQELHRAIYSHICHRGKRGLLVWHTPNGGYRRPVEAAILKSMGVRAGVADFLGLLDGKFYSLELKTEAGRPTENQLAWMDEVNEAGGYATIAYGLDEALRVLQTWGWLK